VILVDSNIPMYLVGAAHPFKEAARTLLEVAVARRERLVSDAEVIQEIVHRYVAIDRRAFIDPAVDALVGVVDEVYPIELADVMRAGDLVVSSRLSARDAIHVAVMLRRGIERIMTFDRDIAAVPGISLYRVQTEPS
jgi:predicted nucleic acid-binding protein